MRERDKRTATEHLGADVLSAKKKFRKTFSGKVRVRVIRGQPPPQTPPPPPTDTHTHTHTHKTRQDKRRQYFIWSLIQSYVHRLFIQII